MAVGSRVPSWGGAIARPRHFIVSMARAALMAWALAATVQAHAQNIVEYTHDNVGRITAIKRRAPAGVSITGFAPQRGAPGVAVMITGSHFDPLPANNTVRFNGIAATVTSASATSLVVTVPAAATTGKISVTVGSSTGASGQNFIVTAPDTPTVDSFTPTTGASGTTVTVTGTKFDPAAGKTTVKLNAATLTATGMSTTQFSFAVPANVGSGRISATTTSGTGTSVADFIVPPPGVTATNTAAILRLEPGQTQSLGMPTANQNALLLFDGTVDDYFTLQLGNLLTNPSGGSVYYTVYRPDRVQIASGYLSLTSPTLHLPKLPSTGTYTIVFNPQTTTLNTNVTLVADPLMSLDAAGTVYTTDALGQSIRVRLSLAAGQTVGLGFNNWANTPTNNVSSDVTVYKPDGNGISGAGCAPSLISCEADIPMVPAAGVYTFVIKPRSQVLVSVTAFASTDVTAAPAAGTPYNFNLTRVGQNARLTYTAAAGESFAFKVANIATNYSEQFLNYFVYQPNGALYKQGVTDTSRKSAIVHVPNAQAGVYTFLMSPYRGATATAVAAIDPGIVLTLDGAAMPFATTVPGNPLRFKFNAAVGQRFSFVLQNYTQTAGSASYSTLYRSDETALGALSCGAASVVCRIELPQITIAGTYYLELLPYTGTTVAGEALLTSEITGTLTADTPQVVDLTRAGRNGRFSFAGTAGTQPGIEIAGVGTTPAGRYVMATLLSPAGANLGSVSGTVGAYLFPAPLATTGTYTVVLSSEGGAPATVRVTVDSGKLLTLDGPTDAFTTSVAGEMVRYDFNGTAGQRVQFGIAGLGYGGAGSSTFSALAYGPGNNLITTFSCNAFYPAGNCKLTLPSLATTGRYTVLIPLPNAVSAASGTALVSTPITGTLSVGGGAQSLAITRVGQGIRYSFDGTAGQLLRANLSGFSFSPATTVIAYLYKPNGVQLTAIALASGATGFDLPALTDTGTYVLDIDNSYGVTMSGTVSLATR